MLSKVFLLHVCCQSIFHIAIKLKEYTVPSLINDLKLRINFTHASLLILVEKIFKLHKSISNILLLSFLVNKGPGSQFGKT